MSICSNPGNFENENITSQKVNNQVSDPIKDNFGSEEANTSSSNLSINFNNYKNNSSSSDSQEDDLSDLEDFDGDDLLDQQYAFMSQCGSKSKTIKKHSLSGKYSSKFISIPPRFQIVDGEKFNFKLSNEVDNRLEIKNTRKQKEDKTTFNFDVDENSNNLLSTMLQNQVLEKITGVIGKYKEYTIFHAYIGPNFSSKPNLPKECTIKVFIPSTPLDAIRRIFTTSIRPKGNWEKKMGQKIAENKANKEYIHLKRFADVHLPCPKVIARNKNILFLSFIGKIGTVSQNLEDVDLTDNEYVIVYNKVVKVMRILFQEFHLIHADLSPYDILWHDNECYFTDFNQTIHTNEVNYFKTLFRNCTMVESYFSKKGVEVTSYEIFKFVTNYDYWDKESLYNIHLCKNKRFGVPGNNQTKIFEDVDFLSLLS